ncbi:hypothetical protein GJ744_011930 [Endocarpon pusillum]|uniref:Ring-like domain-containing protein n=1 Tax=Endocarpon pusillum TaxID=364733 RepID=A0A8H7ATT7_9EURO|nr:hypothetical protein GJ744_011930 [Endocarpon pusillum]
MEYFNYVKSKAHIGTAKKSENPVLTEEDEHFLNRITSHDEQPPPLPARPQVQDLPVAGETQGNDAQLALLDGAQNIALPETPKEGTTEPEPMRDPIAGSEKGAEKKSAKKTWSWLRRDSRDYKRKNQTDAAESLMHIAEGVKSADAQPNEDNIVSEVQAKKEQDDMAMVLEKLNLAAVNNRVFSISEETQELLQKFNQVFKDLVNGVPTAYDDLESLLTNGDQQLQKTFNHLPTFLQKLIAQLPNKMKDTIAPELMAAAAQKVGKSGTNTAKAEEPAGAAKKKKGFKTPNLKDIAGKPGTIASMMRTIITFLRARFPAFLGMNVLWSLALFVLLFVFWYCHKRGKEVRLEKERRLTEEEEARLDAEYRALNPDGNHTTTAPEGAPLEEVQQGIIEAQVAREAAAEDGLEDDVDPSVLSTTVQPAEKVGT